MSVESGSERLRAGRGWFRGGGGGLRRAFLGGMLAFYGLGGPAEEAKEEVITGIRLRGGSFLPGSQWRIASEAFVLNPAWSPDSLRVPFSEVAYWMRLAPGREPEPFDAAVETHSGEQVTVRNPRLRDGKLRMRTAGDEEQTVDWNRVRRLRWMPQGRRRFHGPYSSQLWELQVKLPMEDGPNPFAGKLHTMATRHIYRSPEFRFPKRFLMEAEFRLPHRESNHRLYLNSYQDGGQTRAHITLIFLKDQLSVQWTERGRHNRWVRESWSEKIPGDREVQRLRLYGNTENGSMTVMVGEQTVHTFEVAELSRMVDSEISLGLQTMVPEHPITLNQFTVLKWDGEEAPSFARAGGMDRVLAYDGKVVTGEVEEITGDHVVVSEEGSGERLRLGRGTVYEILRSGGEVPPSPSAAGMSTLFTGHPGDRLFLRVSGVESGDLLGASPVWGENVRIPLSSLEFWRPQADKAEENGEEGR